MALSVTRELLYANIVVTYFCGTQHETGSQQPWRASNVKDRCAQIGNPFREHLFKALVPLRKVFRCLKTAFHGGIEATSSLRLVASAL
jgi:hypothetical protein